MIAAQTLFILGAGAHVPYGMPDGNQLTLDIIKELPVNLPDLRAGGIHTNSLHDVYYLLYAANRLPLTTHRLISFRKAIAYAAHSSIDSFLVSYRDEEGFPEIGKLAVAKVLLHREFKQNLMRGASVSKDGRDWDWLTYLFREMLKGTNGTVEDFLDKNKVAFVTFNYDRTLERFFYIKLQHTFRLKPADALAALSIIDIKHVYGSLGRFDPERQSVEGLTPKDYKAAADSIHLMYEDRGKEGNHDLLRAMRLWDHSNTIIFLGFAFDEQNIKILNLNRGSNGKLVAATRYKVADGDWFRAIRPLNPTEITAPTKRDWDSLMLLQESTLF